MDHERAPHSYWRFLLALLCFLLCWLHAAAISLAYDAHKGFPRGSAGKESACNAGDLGSIPGLGRSPGERNGYPRQCSGLENLMDGGARWATVHGVTKSQTRLRSSSSIKRVIPYPLENPMFPVLCYTAFWLCLHPYVCIHFPVGWGHFLLSSRAQERSPSWSERCGYPSILVNL